MTWKFELIKVVKGAKCPSVTFARYFGKMCSWYVLSCQPRHSKRRDPGNNVTNVGLQHQGSGMVREGGGGGVVTKYMISSITGCT